MNPTHFMFYERILHPGSGFLFPCSSDGEINDAALTDKQRVNLKACRTDRWSEFRVPRVIENVDVNLSHP